MNESHINTKKVTVQRKKKLTKSQISQLFTCGTKYIGKYATFLVVANDENATLSLFLFTVSKKICIKPQKNTVKRRMREIIREIDADIPKGYNFVIIAHKNHASFQMLKEDIRNLMSKFIESKK